MDLRNKKGAIVHFHSSEDMHEIEDKSAKLVIGASVYLEGKPWSDYMELYQKVYVDEGQRILQDDGYFVLIQTDAYEKGRVVCRNATLVNKLKIYKYEVIDVKVWRRRAADFFQVPFSMVHVFRKAGTKTKRPLAKNSRDYFQGIWNYPQTKGGALNAYPTDLCTLLVKAFTNKGDLIVDPFAGTGRLLGVASELGRRAIGYEIDTTRTLRETIKANLNGLTITRGFF
jgi:hypothetical protein